MKKIFCDANYWVALLNKRDQLYEKAKEVSESLGQFRGVTTDEVLNEFLTFYSKGTEMRSRACQMVRKILDNPNTEVIRQTHDSFLKGLKQFEDRPDKEYSLTDCISMVIMKNLGIVEVLSDDKHFKQEGFTILLND